jgi:hypothetical protein
MRWDELGALLPHSTLVELTAAYASGAAAAPVLTPRHSAGPHRAP